MYFVSLMFTFLCVDLEVEIEVVKSLFELFSEFQVNMSKACAVLFSRPCARVGHSDRGRHRLCSLCDWSSVDRSPVVYLLTYR